jgi:hypothetical protein
LEFFLGLLAVSNATRVKDYSVHVRVGQKTSNSFFHIMPGAVAMPHANLDGHWGVWITEGLCKGLILHRKIFWVK